MTVRDHFILGVYDDEEKVLTAVDELQRRGFQIEEVFSPFPIHGLDPKLGLNKSRLPRVAFWAGVTGGALALFMQTYMLAWDWPMDIGGKPFWALPSFIPITFELTILITALTMVGAYMYVNRLSPAWKPDIADIRQTDDRFVVLVKKSPDDGTNHAIRQAFEATDIVETRDTEMTILETEIQKGKAALHAH